ncbi:hypothetical protein KA005_08305 [bacterium]|nr:hypothetical protein [bacterium]
MDEKREQPLLVKIVIEPEFSSFTQQSLPLRNMTRSGFFVKKFPNQPLTRLKSWSIVAN